MHYEVLIAGAGPSGAVLGTLLARANISVCIIDKQVFPRDKLCGGLVTLKTKDSLRRIFPTLSIDLLAHTLVTHNCSIQRDGSAISSFETDLDLTIVERKELDFALLQEYISTGNRFIQGAKTNQIDTENKRVILDSDEVISYSILVGADGANSLVRKHVCPAYRPNGFCVEVRLPKNSVSLNSDELQVDVGIIGNGFGWVFPSRDFFAIGIGGLLEDNKGHFVELFRTYLLKLGIDSNISPKGFPIPFGEYVPRPLLDNILLVGDAAGLVDPITGEGMYYAVTSAEYAAKSIIGCIKNGEALDTYLSYTEEIHAEIDDAIKARGVFYNGFTQKVGLTLAKGHTRYMKYVVDNCISTNRTNYLDATKKYFLNKLRFRAL